MIAVVEDREEIASRFESLIAGSNLEAVCFSCVVSLIESGETPELLLLRAKLPGLSGLSFLKLRDQLDSLANVPVIVIAGSVDTDDVFYQAGAVDVIKPSISDAALLSKITHFSSVAKNTSAEKANDTPDVVQGSLRHIELIDFIQMMASSRSTGMIQLHDNDQLVGQLVFIEGELKSASSGLHQGEDAFTEIIKEAVSLKKQIGGNALFRYSSDVPKDVEENIDSRIDHLLLSVANLLDEAG